VSNKEPTLLKVYIIPVLLLNIAVGSWGIMAARALHGLPLYLGYVLIVTVGLYLYLLYLGRYI
jgi:hypothetical protein